ncbi:MAG TPA: hypothetical protein PKG84_05590 [Novosphingobium sp.]|nr:hypothetical protein [Novosphingobium sp.]
MSNLELGIFLGVISLVEMTFATVVVRYALSKLGHAAKSSKRASIVLALVVLTAPPLLFGDFMEARGNLFLFAPSAVLIFVASVLRDRFRRGRNHSS